jgi:hypothetical protein
MAKVWRGYRLIVVTGGRFRWACHFHHPMEVLSRAYAKRGATWTLDTLLVRPEDQPERLLRVTWPACYGPVLKPAFVRACIEEATRRGWPSQVRNLEFAGSELSIPGADHPNHEAVEAALDLIADREPRHPNVRKLE